MTTEEKAIAYDELKVKAQELEEDGCFDKLTLFDLFQELAESEDEKIRKELIEYIKDQQSSFISAPDCRDKYEEEENNKYNSWIAWLEKQAEKGTIGNEKKIPFSEKKPAWSEEDKINLDWLITVCERIHYKSDPQVSPDSALGLKNWLKGIKDRMQPQPKQEWSEEDERIRIETIELLETANHPNKMRSNGKPLDFTENIDWLKSLRPQSHWEPSDELMEALDDAIDICSKQNNDIGDWLDNLREQLKKLKEA